MTIGNFKKKVFTLLEEYDSTNANLTADTDLALKINHCIDGVQKELATIKRIQTVLTINTEADGREITLPDDFYQISKIKECDFEVLNNKIIIDENYSGEVNIYYDKIPATIDDTTLNTANLEISLDAIEAMVYGVASALLKADISSNYSVYEYKYQEMKQRLSNNKTSGIIRFVEME